MPGSTVMVDHGVSNGNGGSSGGKGGKRPLPHIEDITSVTVEIEAYTPIERVLQMAETYLRQAESSKNFGRPDLALKDYIRATTIIVTEIKKMKGWVSMQNDNKAQWERYQRLLKQIDTAHGDFAAIKAEIKADNARTGVKPINHGPISTAGANGHGHRTAHSISSNRVSSAKGQSLLTSPPTSPQPRAKPIVHPKPQSLHGNALRPSGGGESRATQAQQLAERFANLRINPAQSSHKQTPQTITSPTKSSVDATFADLPKVPDAIYNPPRGTISNEAAQLPSSTPNMFSRTVPTVPVSLSKPISPPPATPELFVTAKALGAADLEAITQALDKSREYITLDELYEALDNETVLLIDIRPREEFDRAHISSSAPVCCIEPEVLARPEISANQIADSMILAPAAEQLLFENRHAFRRIVFYDQNSRAINAQPKTPQEKAINAMFVALEFYDFPGRFLERPGPRPAAEEGDGRRAAAPKPQAKLLSGGFDAWVQAGNPVGTSFTKVEHKYKASRPPREYYNQPHKWVPRPIQDPAEIKRWEALAINRTYEDFFSRYPAIDLRESMTSPVVGDKRPAVSLPPVRPPPAVPRRSYTGLADVGDVEAIGRAPRRQAGVYLRTGISNPGSWCYANSLLQALFASWGFSSEIYGGDWLRLYQVPLKPGETAQGQLLMRFLMSIFNELQRKAEKTIYPIDFMEYLQRIHRASFGRVVSNENVFGTNYQQDVLEFYDWLMSIVNDETNIHRDQADLGSRDYAPRDGSYTACAIDYWTRWTQRSASLVDKYFRGVEVTTLRCTNNRCNTVTRRYSTFQTLNVTVDPATDPVSMMALLRNQTQRERVTATCDVCAATEKWSTTKLARLPDRLAVCLLRSTFIAGVPGKITNTITFDFVNVDLTPFMAEEDRGNAGNLDHHYAGDMTYDVYAVTVHIGETSRSGHYITYVREWESGNPHDWIKLNDTTVTRVRVGSPRPRPPGDVTDELWSARGNDSGAYMIYLRRRGY
ncbi:hypothetical protein QBC38DRAFT_6120 [Podospora fimiseda]|uniref:ubiquitinyl hydrolase 1 n=1 Tax=Podospora fimiseda TaxID=252190 RepID=A0AAN7C042_9PEZI|nr:hypothetical protein QBC38DRAFT_6120 [Podospora fimiseda]